MYVLLLVNEIHALINVKRSRSSLTKLETRKLFAVLKRLQITYVETSCRDMEPGNLGWDLIRYGTARHHLHGMTLPTRNRKACATHAHQFQPGIILQLLTSPVPSRY